ncbi:MAG TPA: toxin-antitoxin system protein [Cyanobacteria bacterium UBA11369]|nr:toxin-antitoxin system protein [Cyanobacteria bacterium UBA11371]HBE34683.1 toxin-antitoxin system protein [Cyanobacteria bacterium UBA11368]HBE47870.1 toxin-antitoxin system protein [Cyanobacteria bacterium UBA11369]
MESSTVTIGSTSYKTLQELAARSGESIQEILEKAIEQYRRQKFLEEANQAYAALRNNPEAWASEIEEREAWDVTLADGLE